MSANFWRRAAIVTAGGAIGFGVVVYGVPFAVGAVGFKASGITAGSWAAKMMSRFGGETPRGGFVAECQSIGATETVSRSNIVLGIAAGGAAGYLISGNDDDGPNDEPDQRPDQEQREEESDEENGEDEEQNI